MDEVKPIPRNRTLGYIADALRSGKGKMSSALSGANRDYALPFGLGTKRLNVGDFATSMVFGDAPDEVDRWSQGDAPMRMNNLRGSKALFEMKEDRAGPLFDAVFLGADAAGGAGLAAKGASRMVQALRKAPSPSTGYDKVPPTPEPPNMSEQFDPSRRDAIKKIAGGTAAAAGVAATAPDALRAVIAKAVEASPMVNKAAEVAAPIAKAFHFQGFKPWGGAWNELTPLMQSFMRHRGMELADDVVADPVKRAEFDAIVNQFPEGSDEATYALMERGFMRAEPRMIAGENGEDFLDDLPDHLRKLYENDPDFSRENLRRLAEDSELGDDW
jgi:hypothetical protein